MMLLPPNPSTLNFSDSLQALPKISAIAQFLKTLPLLSVLAGSIALSPSVQAQLIPDETLESEQTTIQSIDQFTDLIEGGAIRNNNLFHSFLEFNVGEGRSVDFANPEGIANIFSRVTGGNPSEILGHLGVLGEANLFLLNPNGILFGPNATLNVMGSFVATTADGVLFESGLEFSATDPDAPPLLTVNVPIGLQFGPESSVTGDGHGGSIRVPGPGHNLNVALETTEILRHNRPVGLQVPAGQTLALVGGDIAIEGGNLTAAGGRIELGTVAGSGQVTLTPANSGWQLGYEGVSSFGDIHLSDAASLEVSGNGGGEIQVQGRRVSLRDGSLMLADTLGSEPGGLLAVRASEAVEVIGSTEVEVIDTTTGMIDPNKSEFPSGLFAQVNSEATGHGGDLIVETLRLLVADGAQVTTKTLGFGDAGELTVRAIDVVEAIGTSANGNLSSGIFATVEGGASGNGGNLTVETPRLRVREGAEASVNTLGFGDGGNLTVRATDSIELGGISANGRVSGLLAQTARGNGGTVTIETGHLRVTDGAVVSASTFGSGDAGNLTVRATDSIELDGISANGRISGLLAQVNGNASGNGGTVTIETPRLLVTDGARVSVNTFGSGNAGNLTVRATDSIELMGIVMINDETFSSSLEAQVRQNTSAKGGTVTIETGRLLVADGAQVSAITFGEGKAGDVTVRADEVEVIGFRPTDRGRIVPSALLTEVARGVTGNGGTVTIETGRLLVADGGLVSAITFGEGEAGDVVVRATNSVEVIGRSSLVARVDEGTGNGGNVTVDTPRLLIADGAQLQAGTFGEGDAGNLTVRADEVELIGTSEGAASGLFTSAIEGSGSGGELMVTAGRLIVRDGATVSASNFQSQNLRPPGSGPAGSIEVQAGSILLDNSGRITAAAAVGDRGNITLNAADLQMRRGSRITTNARGEATGGNIMIDTDTLVALENSDISANAEAASGGQVTIDALGIFGTEFRQQTTPQSDITATSELGPQFSGTVTLNTPDLDPASGLVGLPENPVDAASLIGQDPCSQGRGSELVATGRGGLPPNPREALRSEGVRVNPIELNPDAEPRPSPETSTEDPTPDPEATMPDRLVEAQGWVIGPNGEVILTADPPTVRPYSLGQGRSFCQK